MVLFFKNPPNDHDCWSRRILPGFLEAVEILKLGEKGRFIIPPHLGYGEKGARDDFDANKYLVPPNSTIIFEIELMKIK